MHKIIYLSDIGFCKGLDTVIDRLNDLKNHEGNVFSLAPILHNEKECEKLKEEYGISDTLENDSIILFPAHGHTNDEEKMYSSHKTIDTICPIVKSNLDFISANKNKYKIIYFGKKSHRETASVLSYNDDILLVESYTELEAALGKIDNVYVLFQSTIDYIIYKKCELLLKSRHIPYKGACPIYLSRVFDSIKKLEHADSTTSTVLVLGSKTSSNCNSIKNYIQTKHPSFDTYMINSVEELSSIDLKENIYITSSTSISKESVDEIIKAISN